MTDAPHGIKERVLSWVINRAVTLTNRKINIADLQQRHHAQAGRVTQMQVTDLNRVWNFRVQDGRFEVLPESTQADGGFRTSSDTLIAVALGKRRYMNPATGAFFDAPYSPLEALTHGDLKVWGEAASNDALLFAKAVYQEVFPELQQEIATDLNARTGA